MLLKRTKLPLGSRKDFSEAGKLLSQTPPLGTTKKKKKVFCSPRTAKDKMLVKSMYRVISYKSSWTWVPGGEL